MEQQHISVVGSLVHANLDRLAPTLMHAWQVEWAPHFDELLWAIDDADHRLNSDRTVEPEGLYFAERELAERGMSYQAPDPRAAAAHAELAERYEALAVVFRAKSVLSPPVDYR